MIWAILKNLKYRGGRPAPAAGGAPKRSRRARAQPPTAEAASRPARGGRRRRRAPRRHAGRIARGAPTPAGRFPASGVSRLLWISLPAALSQERAHLRRPRRMAPSRGGGRKAPPEAVGAPSPRGGSRRGASPHSVPAATRHSLPNRFTASARGHA